MKFFLSNWKMHTTVPQAVEWIETVQDGLRRRARHGRPVARPIVCPPFVSLVPAGDVMDRSLMSLGAQSCHWEAEGPYTGEVSPTMLQGIVEYVMVGHSERRAAGESDDQVSRKVAAVAQLGLVPILFVGEKEADQAGEGQPERQLERGLSGVDPEVDDVVVVYEPAWAVGADEAAEVDHVRKEVDRLKSLLLQLGSPGPTVVYGGTVNEENIDRFARLPVLDGVGATRASLDPHGFLALLDRIAAVQPDSGSGRPARDQP